MNLGLGPTISADAIASAASNIKASENPPYLVDNFLAFYPQFGNDNVPTGVIQAYVNLAAATLQQSRFKASWEIVMGYFIAHFCILWLRGSEDVLAGKDAISASGDIAGIVTSESVDGVSYSMDVGSIMQDLDGFAMWKTTSFGLQLATFAKLYGKGGMMVR